MGTLVAYGDLGKKNAFIRIYSKYTTFYYVYVYVLMTIYRNEPATAEKNGDMKDYDTDSDTMC